MSHLDQKAFFDGEVGVQRFDIVRHKMLEKMNNVMLSQFWRPEEIDVTGDRADYNSLEPHQQHIFVSNLKRQIVLDTKQGREPLRAFLPLASSPENECAITEWSFQELIHSRSYTHIIRGVLNDPSEIFDNIFDVEEIVDMAEDISKYYDDLIRFNEMKAVIDNEDHSTSIRQAVSYEYDEYEHKKAMWRALFAVNALEGVRFYVSFACSWAFAEMLEKMEGNAKIIKLICRDENNHLKLTQTYLTRILMEDPDFVKIKAELAPEMVHVFMDVVKQEKQWAKYLFKDGSMLGLNADILCQYVDWIASKRLAAIGLQYPEVVEEKNPLPWTQHWIAGDNKQTALQEAENDSYLLGILEGNITDAAKNLSVLFPEISGKVVPLTNVVVYSKEDCPFCLRAKAILHKHGNGDFDEYVLDKDFTREEFLDRVPEHHRTYPAIYVDGEFVGGYDDLIKFISKR